MISIYEWLYSHYYTPYFDEIPAEHKDMAEEARRLLLEGPGTALDRTDALRLLQDLWGTAAFAAGVGVGLHLMTDAGVPPEATPLSEAL